MMRRNEAESGMISLWALVLSSFVFIVGLAMAAYFSNMGRMSAEYVVETRLRFAAESAAEHAAHQLEGTRAGSIAPFSKDYDVAYKKEHYHADVTAQVENETLVITSTAYRVEKPSTRDWDRHKVRRAVLKQEEKKEVGTVYVWDGWME